MGQDGERALVPLAPKPAGSPPVSDGRIDVGRLLAAAFGLAMEAQRRSLEVAGRFGWPLRVLVRPAVVLTRGSVAAARHHLDLDGWAARGLAEQRRAQAAAVEAVRGLIAALAAAVLDEIDLDELVARVDLDRVIDRVDLDAVVARVDIEAIVARVDLPGLTEQVIEEVDLGEIIRESSSTMASETVDALRVQGMRVDGLVSRLVDRLLLRDGQRQTGPLLEEPRP